VNEFYAKKKYQLSRVSNRKGGVILHPSCFYDRFADKLMQDIS
jgi:hypothetical protein